MNYSKWNDNRKTNAFKSTRRNNNSHQKEENNRPINTRIWKNKTIDWKSTRLNCSNAKN